MGRCFFLLTLLAGCSEPRVMMPVIHVYTIATASVSIKTPEFDCQPNYNDPIDVDDYRLECPKKIPSVPILDGGK